MAGRRLGALAAVALAVAAVACGSREPSRWDDAQNRSTQQQQNKAAENAPPAKAGGDLNQFFPKVSGEYDRVASQEKEGFSEYKLKRGGKDVAMLTISDTRTNPEAAEKFKGSTRQIGGFPAADLGATQTAVLVGDRYQVKVLSRDPSFTKADREAWLQKFDLKGLEAMK
jgi:hypothetical protein